MLLGDRHIDINNVQRDEFVYFYSVLRCILVLLLLLLTIIIIIIISSGRIENAQATTEVSKSKTRGTYVSFTQMVHSYKGERSVLEGISHKILKAI